MTSSLSGHVKGDTENGWAHRKATADEQLARQILTPWFQGARNEKGERIPLHHFTAILNKRREEE